MNSGKILAMDDEEEIRYIFTKMLNRINYEVEVAREGNEAIELFKRAIEISKPFDTVLLDLKLADGMGGEEAIKRLLEVDPVTKIIFSSGSVSDPVIINYRNHGACAVLRKPFKYDQLRSVLQSVNRE